MNQRRLKQYERTWRQPAKSLFLQAFPNHFCSIMKSLFTKINDSAGLLQGSPSPFEGKREPVYWSAAQGTEIEDKDMKGLYFLGAVWEITVLGSTVTIVGFEVCNSLLCTLKRYLLNIQLGIGDTYIFAEVACKIALECIVTFKK